MKYIIILTLAVLTGCSTVVPVTVKFPEVPIELRTACDPLQKLDNGAKLSDVARTMAENYGTYYQCSAKVDSWNEWYHAQQELFEKVGR